jgi:DNA-binding transcriptional ArsR family regulator
VVEAEQADAPAPGQDEPAAEAAAGAAVDHLRAGEPEERNGKVPEQAFDFFQHERGSGMSGANIPTFLRMLEYLLWRDRAGGIGWSVNAKTSVVRNPGVRSMKLERVVKGFSNHRRIEILELLRKTPEMSVCEIAGECRIEFKTASEHIRRLAIAGLVLKRHKGREVRHALTERALRILEFLDKLV